MPLVYYRDSLYAPVLNGNAYATLSQIEPLLHFHPRWKYLDSTHKENAICNASAQIDIMSFIGSKVDNSQSLQFPRDGIGSVQEQDRKLLQAVSSQVEYNLVRAGIGVTSYTHGNESLTSRQEIICREAQGALERYLRD